MNRYLLDTHLIYWWMTADARVGQTTQSVIEQSEIVVSVASVWEMALKNAKGKLPLPPGSITEALEAQGFLLLRVFPVDGMTAPRLPLLKSYSLRMVLLRFAFAGLARRDQPGSALAR